MNKINNLVTLLACFCLFLFLCACGTTLKHVSSKKLDGINVQRSVNVMVADIGDVRENEPLDRIGQGVSFWLPVSYYARDEKDNILPVSYYIAQSLSDDINKIGHKTKIANKNAGENYKPLSLEESIAIAKKEGIDFLVTTKVKDAKTNFWGFIIIPFVQPVWTRFNLESQLINIKDEKNIVPIQTDHSETEWYFAKITILDAIFDAGIFGRNWHSTAWGETVISDALAKTTLQIKDKIQ